MLFPEPDAYFLTGSVSLVPNESFEETLDEIPEDVKRQSLEEGTKVGDPKDTKGAFFLYGINLDYTEYAHPEVGNFDSDHYMDRIESRRQLCAAQKWRAKDIQEFGGNFQIYLLRSPDLTDELMQLIWEWTQSPTGTPLDQINFNEKISRIKKPKSHIPIISWLHEIELLRIVARREKLSPNKNNPVIKAQWEFHKVAQQVIEAWFSRNELDIPKIYVEGQRGYMKQRFLELIDEALYCGQQTPEQLWEWKARFSEFEKGTFFSDFYKDKDQTKLEGEGSGNGLEWRNNDLYKYSRGQKPKK